MTTLTYICIVSGAITLSGLFMLLLAMAEGER